MNWILIVYVAAISLFAVIITIFDKVRAMRGGWRVKEATLLLTAFFGGSAAMLLTMLLIRHKIRKAKFMLGIQLIIALQIAVVYCVRRFCGV